MKLILKELLFIIFLLMASINGCSQNSKYLDLLVLYVDEDYEKCLKKCEKYMSKEESKKDPLPYLYASMSYYGISRDNQYKEEYPKAYRKALSYVTKYRRKDKEYLYKEDAEEYIESLKFIIAEEIENYNLDRTDKSNRKIASLLKKATRMDPDDAGVLLMQGVYEMKAGNRSEGKKLIKEGEKRVLESIANVPFGEMTKSQQYYLKKALINYTGLLENKEPEKAIRIIKLGEDLFLIKREDCYLSNNEDFQKKYDQIISR